MSQTIELAKSLISKASVTPDDNGCQAIMIDRLKRIGFTIKQLKFDDDFLQLPDTSEENNQTNSVNTLFS